MLLSLEDNWIFLKPKKAAGTTIEGGLRIASTRIDIGTPMIEGEEQQVIQLGGAVLKNAPIPLQAWRLAEFRRFLRKGFAPPEFRYHHPARAMRSAIGHLRWDALVKISATRNPFDQMVSLFYWRKKNTRPDAGNLPMADQVDLFSRFVRARVVSEAKLIRSVTHIDGKPQIDRWIRFENLEDDTTAVAAELFGPQTGFREAFAKLRLKGEGVRPKATAPADLFAADKRLIGLVVDNFEWEFTHFGYPTDV